MITFFIVCLLQIAVNPAINRSNERTRRLHPVTRKKLLQAQAAASPDTPRLSAGGAADQADAVHRIRAGQAEVQRV
ncbi:MAG TPA: hypothetical protein DCL55_15175, partial [Brevundimonas sp.]|nr:hypothetical protein [Brevundimonas sp.]